MLSAFDIFPANVLPQHDLIAKFSVVVPTEMTVCSKDSFQKNNGDKHDMVEYFCLDCWKALCVECYTVHLEIKVTEQHKVRPVANIDEADIKTRRRQLPSICSLHKDEKSVKFCRQCQDVICSSCFAGGHFGHDYVELKTIDEVDSDTKETVNAIAGREVAVTQHLIPKRTTPQPVSLVIYNYIALRHRDCLYS
jgi:hypothetical protein